MGRLWDIIQQHIDGEQYPPSQRQVAKKLDVSPTTLGNWRAPKDLPEFEHLEAISRLTRVPYRDVLDAALADTGYLRIRDDDQETA